MDEYVALNLTIFRLVGAWIPDDCSLLEKRISLILRLMTVAAGLLIIVPILPEIPAKFNENNISDRVECLILVLSAGINFSKSIACFVRRNEMRNLLSKMNDLWRGATPREVKVMIVYAKIGKTLTKAYLTMGVVTSVTIIAQPIMKDHYLLTKNSSHVPDQFPFDGWLNNHASGTINRSLLFVSHCVAAVLATILSVAYDSMFAVLILHVCANLRAIADSLCRVSSANYIHGDEIRRCVKKLQCVEQYTADLENILSGYLIFQVCFSTITICFIGFVLFRVDLNGNSELIMKYGMYLMMSLYQVFMYCWAGNHLLTQSDEIGKSAYEAYGNLICFNSKSTEHSRHELTQSAKDLQMILLRAQRRVNITAGHFYVMSLECYKKILTNSYSYFTILRAISDKRKI